MTRRGLALIVIAVVLSLGVLAVQLASGGASFTPQRTADPCRDPGRVTDDDLDRVVEVVVVTGVNDAACTLGLSRERLLLGLLSEEERAELEAGLGIDEDEMARTLKEGIANAITRLDRAGQLPKPAGLIPEIADQIGIPSGLVGPIPDVLLNRLPPTAQMLQWSLDRIEVNDVLSGLDQGRSVETLLRDAIIDGVRRDTQAWLRQTLPGWLTFPFG